MTLELPEMSRAARYFKLWYIDMTLSFRLYCLGCRVPYWLAAGIRWNCVSWSDYLPRRFAPKMMKNERKINTDVDPECCSLVFKDFPQRINQEMDAVQAPLPIHWAVWITPRLLHSGIKWMEWNEWVQRDEIVWQRVWNVSFLWSAQNILVLFIAQA